MTDVAYIYLFFSVTLSQKNGKWIYYFDKTNNIANRLFLYNRNLYIYFLSVISFPYVNVKQIVSW